MDQQVLDFLKDFTSILWEAFPFIVLGALIAGILEEVVPQQAIARLVPKNKFLAVALGALLGIIFPQQPANAESYPSCAGCCGRECRSGRVSPT